MIKCEKIVQLLHDYAEGILEMPTQKLLEDHLSDCPGCIAFVNTYKKTMHLSKELRCEDIPPELKQKLRSFIKIKLASRRRSIWSRLWSCLTGCNP